MNSNRKLKLERSRTPVHLNSSEYVFKNSATKRFSPNLSRRPTLNETVRCGSSSDLKFKTKLSTNFEVNYETEFDLAYNDYLQALMKKQFMKKIIGKHEQILEDQLLMQNESVRKREENFEDIVTSTESFQNKSRIVHMIDYLKDNFIIFANVCSKYNMKEELDQFYNTLNLECDKVVLKNIKILETQDEYEKFINVLESCLIATKKIVNSGRNFKEIHNLAQSIGTLSDLVNNVKKSQQTVTELEKEAMYNFLQNMSDFFARRYTECSG